MVDFDRKQTLRILRDLEFLVVSLDRLGSSGEEGAKAQAFDFLVEGNVFKRLASIRRMFWDEVDRTSAPEEVRALERAMESVKYWQSGRAQTPATKRAKTRVADAGRTARSDRTTLDRAREREGRRRR